MIDNRIDTLIVNNLVVNNFNETAININNFDKHYFDNETDFKTFVVEVAIDDC